MKSQDGLHSAIEASFIALVCTIFAVVNVNYDAMNGYLDTSLAVMHVLNEAKPRKQAR